ncbi:MAG: carbohydrate ABC transporter permease, partial [Spirochaetaceae bacterium]|nr:carbohydrate ABC transporter permease [Spirochaetaceae bacterium]
ILNVPPPFGIGDKFVENYQKIVAVIPFWRNFLNSVAIASLVTVSSLLFCSMGGFAFAMYDFPLKRILFSLLLGTMMLPWLVDMIPWFIIVSRLGLRNSYAALVVPGAVSAFGIFWMRQYVSSTVPPSLLDAARIDGCPEPAIFFRIVAPLLGPAFGTLGIMNFLGSWNSFFYPMLVLTKKAMMTLPLAINILSADPYKGMDYGVLMTATTLMLAPVLTVFWAASRRFISGMTAGAIKG